MKNQSNVLWCISSCLNWIWFFYINRSPCYELDLFRWSWEINYAKKETSACVTNAISVEHIYENLQESECMYNLLKRHKPQGWSSPKGRKVKAKVWELIQ
jgi:hypothetical protein